MFYPAYMYVDCVHQEKASDALELESYVQLLYIIWVLGSEPRSFVRAASDFFNHWAISQAYNRFSS